jgi:hypothetical protein
MTVAIKRTGTCASSSSARRTISTKRPDTFSQTVFVDSDSSCSSAADHTCYAMHRTILAQGRVLCAEPAAARAQELAINWLEKKWDKEGLAGVQVSHTVASICC